MEKDKKMVSLEISNDLREALRIEAFRRDCNISSLIRQILEKELKGTLQETRKAKADEDKVAK